MQNTANDFDSNTDSNTKTDPYWGKAGPFHKPAILLKSMREFADT